MIKAATLRTESGITFSGFCPAHQTQKAEGELVFSTGMTGYVESLSDPSYAGQILTFTYPLIGNYGVPASGFWESGKVHLRGVIVSSASFAQSHASAEKTLLAWLQEENVPIMWGVDTRALTKVLRHEGSLLGAFCGSEQKDRLSTPIQDPNTLDLVQKVSTKTPYYEGSGKKTVIAIDCGIKRNILRCLTQKGVRVLVVPYDYDYTDEDADGIFLSNGPGNPGNTKKTLQILQKELENNRPIFGICLGAQLMALAAGASTYKLRFGHRSHNQPCFDHEKNRSILTSQNHGWAIDANSLPKDWSVHFTNLNDGSVEGIRHRTKPHFAVQFHPESAPGPNDARYLFETFTQLL